MVLEDQFSHNSVHYSKAIILLSLLIIVGVTSFVVWPRYFIFLSSENMFFTGNRVSMPDNTLRIDVDDALLSFRSGLEREDVFSNDTDNVLFVSVPMSLTTVTPSISLYINYTDEFELTYVTSWEVDTSNEDTLFLFEGGSLIVSRSLNSAIPETWLEMSAYSDDGDTEYIRTYRAEGDEVHTYYTFIQRGGASFVLTTVIPKEQSFDLYFSIITSFKLL